MGRFNKREHGFGTYRDRDTGKVTAEYRGLQCVHCGMHWLVVPGSGIRRGWCMNCNGPECGKDECFHCVHWHQRLENIEAGRPELFKPIQIVVPPELYAADSVEKRLFYDPPDRFNVGEAGDSKRGDSVHGVRPEARDGPAGELAGLQILPDAGTEGVADVAALPGVVGG